MEANIVQNRNEVSDGDHCQDTYEVESMRLHVFCRERGLLDSIAVCGKSSMIMLQLIHQLYDMGRTLLNIAINKCYAARKHQYN